MVKFAGYSLKNLIANSIIERSVSTEFCQNKKTRSYYGEKKRECV